MRLTRVAMLATSAHTNALPLLRGVVFDMDGTLTKPNLDFVEMYRRCGVDRSTDILAAIASMPPAEAAAANAVVDEMEAEGRRTLELFPGAVECCKWFSAHGIPTALVTRNTQATVAHLHRALWKPAGLRPFAPAISRDDLSVPPKPDPTALHTIAESWGVATSELLMVGDSAANDVAFGKRAGAATALVDSGRAQREGGDGLRESDGRQDPVPGAERECQRADGQHPGRSSLWSGGSR